MKIIFGKKFTAIDLENMISNHWEQAKETRTGEKVIFDLKELEWIALEELTFLFGWFRYLLKLGQKIYIELPPVTTSSLRKKKRLISLYYRWQITAFVSEENKLLEYFNFNPISINKLIDEEVKNEKYRQQFEDKNWHKVIPFYTIDADDSLRKGSIHDSMKSKLETIFTMEQQVENLLNSETLLSPFENKTLSHIITTELFLNVVHHAFDEKSEGYKQCYLAVVLCNKRDIKAFQESRDSKMSTKEAAKQIQKILKNNYTSERPEEERDFFRNKKHEYYENNSYIEFTFIDFGKGIPSTLRDKYEEDIANEEVKAQLSSRHNDKISKDSRILEYAFLFHTSRFPFEKNIEMQNYVPRGLYFLIDIVRRYSGMLIVRSNKGKIVFDLSDNSKEIKDCVHFSEQDNKLPYFQGTLISIVIPASKKPIALSAVQRKLSISASPIPKYEHKYISIADILKEVTKDIQQIGYPNQIYNLLFKSLNDKLCNFNKNHSIVIIDFAGCENHIIDRKIYYYLCNTPNINEYCRAIVLNPPDKSLLLDVQYSLANSSTGFLSRPIPCIFPFKEIIWIGLKNPKEDEPKLNELWKYLDKIGSLATSDFREVEGLRGNMITIEWIDPNKEVGNVSMSIPSFDKVSKYYAYEKSPENYILNLISDPINQIRLQKNGEVFWTSSGYYQKEFLSFIEMLFYASDIGQDLQKRDEYFGRKVAKFFLNKFMYKHGYSSLPKIHKIVAVTLSSQILAKYIQDVYFELTESTEESEKPFLVKLSNYYDFVSEKPFQKIKKGENILIVNDVISSGKLNKRIYKSLTENFPNGREANVIAMFALVDTRIHNSNNDNMNTVEQIFNTDIEKKLICLAKYPIEKYRTNPEHGSTVVVINPVLNAPSTMGLKRSETFKLIFSDTQQHAMMKKTTMDFINRIDNKFLWVGHLHHNTVHHTYFVKTADLFRSNNGKELLKEILSSITQKEKSINSEKNTRMIPKLISDITKFKNEISNGKHGGKKIVSLLDNTCNYLLKLENMVSQTVLPIEESSTNIDYIFYPIYSGAEFISKENLSYFLNLRETDFFFFPLPRIATAKGWRFTFPPKMLNKLSKDKKILIIDDGSCTGETLLQMIDTVCFLKVAKILVLSVVARLEDFQREFFARIQKIKVDYTREEEKTMATIAPIDIYFGVHLHIPIFPAFTSLCPLCEEKQQLNYIKDNKDNLKPPNSVLNYIEKRIQELQEFETDGFPFEPYDNYDDKVNCPTYPGIPSYLPEDIDVKKMYIIRDKLGKLETYRLFTEYLKGFETEELDSDTFEIFMAVILHEHKLYNVVKQFLPEIDIKLKDYVRKIIYDNYESDRFVKWNKVQLLKFHYILNQSDFFSSNKLISILQYTKNDAQNNNDAFHYLAYLMWYYIMNIEKDNSRQKQMECLVIEIWKYSGNKLDKIYSTMIKEIIDCYENKIEKSIYSAYSNILYFYMKKDIDENHSEIEFKLLEFISNLLQKNFDFESFKTDFDRVYSTIKGKLVANIENLNSENFLKCNFDTCYHFFFEEEKSIMKIMRAVKNHYDSLKQNINNSHLETYKKNLREALKDLKDYIISATSEFAKFFLNYETLDIKQVWFKAKRNKSEKIASAGVKFIDKKFEYSPIQKVFIFESFLNTIFSELIGNTCKYNKNITCVCDLEERDSKVIFSIEQPTPIKKEKGKGIKQIEAIAKRFDGEFRIDPTQTEGAKLLLILPSMPKQLENQ